MNKNNYNEYLEDFTQTGFMLHEPVMLYKIGDKQPCGNIRYKPISGVSVMNSGLNIKYTEGKDYKIEDNTIIMLPNSKMMYITDELYHVTKKEENLSFQKACDGVNLVLFTNSPYIIEHQIAVSYEFDKSECKIEYEKFDDTKLKNTLCILKNKKPLKYVLYGDSITCGFNSSFFMNVEPFLPTWGELIKWKLEDRYNTSVNMINSAVNGMDSGWGAANAKKLIAENNPDLTVLAFGMNDGTLMVKPEKFKENIKSIIDTVGQGDFILVAPMLANPDSAFVGYQEAYYDVLKELVAPNIKVIGMANIHKELLINKKYCDYTGNNINHPNDFLARCYAINILKLLIDTDTSIKPC
ncbi:MAG: SGNH/GDSL hydrolase family protein [Oscillospiraceae bacterium]|nr:SGNH/GDSL hydrolase family protein [Oscillospiraceae bacterium]